MEASLSVRARPFKVRSVALKVRSKYLISSWILSGGLRVMAFNLAISHRSVGDLCRRFWCLFHHFFQR